MSGCSGKVLHVFDHSFPISDGYAFRSGEILRNLHRSGWRTAQLTSSKQGPTAQDVETFDDLDFYRTQPSRRPLDRLPLLNQWAVVATLRRRLFDIIPRERPDLLHAHSPVLNGMAALAAARRFRLPLVYEIRALWEDAAVDQGTTREGDLRYRLTRALETRVVRRADAVTCICEGLRNDLLQRGVEPAKVTVVPNAVDLERFDRPMERDAELAGRLGLSPGKTLGFIGSFYAFEGLHVLLHAMPAILAQDPEIRLVLVGDGEQAEALRRQARDLALGDRVVFTGRVAHADVERYYGVVDILIYPRISKRITELVTPLKPLEAMAQGRLVLASDVGGHRELIQDGRTGVLFRSGSADALAQACLALLRQPERWPELRTEARRYVQAERGWAQNILRYEQVYRTALSARARLTR